MNASIDPSTITKNGFLEKKGGQVKNWKKRWFVISNNTLYYFKDIEMKELAGYMKLIDTTVSYEEPTEGPGFYFLIKFPVTEKMEGRSEYLVRAQNPQERDDWKEAIIRSTKITVFGKPLMNALRVNPEHFGIYLPIPYFFRDAIDYISKNSMDVEGIYRLNGSQAQIDSFIELINSNQAVQFSDPHNTTGLIKQYMRKLPEPLFLKKNYQQLKNIISIQDEKKQIEAVSTILRSLPLSNYLLLHFMFKHLCELNKHSDKTKMDTSNLAMCMGPSLLTCDEDTTSGAYGENNVQQNIGILLLTHFDKIFGTNPFIQYGSTSLGKIVKVSVDLQPNYPYVLQAPKGGIIQVVSEDKDGWAVAVYNDKWGVVHQSQTEEVSSAYEVLRGLAVQEKKWTLPPEELTRLSQKCPESVQLYEALASKLNELRSKAKHYL